jgi:two-component system cell cycle response regulator DivK
MMSSKWFYNWTGKTILVVEDDQINFNYLDALLKPTMAKVYHAERGEDAIELCRKNSFINIVLMDIRLPGMTGLEATRQLIAIQKDMVVIAQTAYAEEWDREAALAAGCCEFIAKPIRANEMLSLIKKHLKD